ncbi:uncharacterized protein LOC132600652 isoform X2 [Lycium barbarum]|uniref:uncharacterized protein LOC132600652 isoform X2 n=1 Tax=Lycium barbarum TaxID=112863 RepID=UPI00293E11DE|nr:uncharacterized protein LOC132600652 isoform X2 [Lycium barbarum]
MKKYLSQVPNPSLTPHNQPNQEANVNQLEEPLDSFQVTSYQVKHEDRVRLAASVDVVRLLIKQGMSFWGYDESESSHDRGNFLEILSWYAKRSEDVHDFVLEHAPQNDQMTSRMIQKDIVTACKIETIKAIIDELNGDYFALLVDKSFDVLHKEHMTIVLRYIDRRGFVVERIIDIVHVQDTSVLSLKMAIVDLLAHHSLSLSYVRGQCYDVESDTHDNIKGLKMLIRQENRSAHSLHCFAHQLQHTLVMVSAQCVQVGQLVLLVSNIMNVLGASFKGMDEFQVSQREKIREALDMGELTTGRNLLQELDLIKADAHSLDERARASGYLRTSQTFEIAFVLHLMKDVLAITYELNESLQKKELDIANAMLLVEIAKGMLPKLKDNGWDPLIDKVSTFCIKHNILIPNFDEPYVTFGRRRKPTDYNVLHHYHVDVFCKIIDWQLQELNDLFDKVTIDLLHGVACLNPIDSFSSFDIMKVMRMAELYPDDFDEFSMGALENQLATYIIDVRDIDGRFSNVNGLCDLSRKLVQTKKHLTYHLVFRLVKLALLLPIATASVERAFAAVKFIKNDMLERMDHEFLRGCLVPYVEREVFDAISNDAIIKKIQELKSRQVQL